MLKQLLEEANSTNLVIQDIPELEKLGISHWLQRIPSANPASFGSLAARAWAVEPEQQGNHSQKIHPHFFLGKSTLGASTLT